MLGWQKLISHDQTEGSCIHQFVKKKKIEKGVLKVLDSRKLFNKIE